MTGDDDDPAIIDWGDQANTAVDDPITVTAAKVVPEPVTDKHRSLDYLGGREAGVTEGITKVIRSFSRELLKAGFTPEEARRMCLRVRTGAQERG